MSNFLIIFICLSAGLIARRSRMFSDMGFAARVLNSVVISVSLPALTFVQIPHLMRSVQPSWELLFPVLMPWAVFLFSWILFYSVGRWRNWSRATTGTVILTAGLGNTSFVGFPLIEALLGAPALKWALLVDQLGSFLTVSTLGLLTAAFFSGREVTGRAIVKRIVYFPPFVSLVLALLWSVAGEPGAEVLIPAFERIGNTLVPLAMLAVGLQLSPRLELLRRKQLPLTLGLFYKLVLAPLAFLGIAGFLFTGDSSMAHVTILEAAMAPMITAGVVASEFDLDRDLAALMVGIGIPISLVTVPIWTYTSLV